MNLEAAEAAMDRAGREHEQAMRFKAEASAENAEAAKAAVVAAEVALDAAAEEYAWWYLAPEEDKAAAEAAEEAATRLQATYRGHRARV